MYYLNFQNGFFDFSPKASWACDDLEDFLFNVSIQRASSLALIDVPQMLATLNSEAAIESMDMVDDPAVDYVRSGLELAQRCLDQLQP